MKVVNKLSVLTFLRYRYMYMYVRACVRELRVFDFLPCIEYMLTHDSRHLVKLKIAHLCVKQI
jgi:hypothetical protein